MADASIEVIRNLFVRLGTLTDPGAVQAIDRFNDRIDGVSNAADNAAKGFRRATVAAAGFVAGGLALAVSAGKAARETQIAATIAETSTDTWQELGFAFETVGLGGDVLGRTLSVLRVRVEEAIGGNEQYRQSLADLGIGLEELRGLDPVAQFERLTQAVGEAKDEGKALAAVNRLLGELVGRRLTPVLLEGAAGLAALREEARALGIVTDEETIQKGADLAKTWLRLTIVGRSLREEVGFALVPQFERAARSALEWARQNRGLINERIADWTNRGAVAVRRFGPILAAAAVAATSLAVAIRAARIAMVLFTTLAAAGVTAQMVLIAGLVLALAGAFVAAGLAIEDWVVFLRGGDSLLEKNLETLSQWIPVAGEIPDLLRAIGGAGAAAWRTVTGLGAALARGLGAPVIAKVRQALAPLLEDLDKLRFVATAISNGASGIARSVTDRIRGASTSLEAAGQALAPNVEALGRQVSTSPLTGQIAAGVASTVLNQSSIIQGARTVDQTFNITGIPGGAESDFVGAQRRQAQDVVDGGAR